MVLFNEKYTLERGAQTPFETMLLERFMYNVAKQVGLIGIDVNAEISPAIKNSIQEKLLSSIEEYKHLLKFDRLFLDKYFNQYKGLNTNILVLRFGRSKFVETINFERKGIPLEDRDYVVQFDFDISYLNEFRIYYPQSYSKQTPSFRKCDRFTFDRLLAANTYCLEYFNGFQELRIMAIPFTNNFYGQIELTGVFKFIDECGTDLAPNYTLAEDVLFRCDSLTIEALQNIVSYKIALANNILDVIPSLQLSLDQAYEKLQRVKSEIGLKF